MPPRAPSAPSVPRPRIDLTRRRFLGLGAAGVGGVALSPYLSSLQAFAAPGVGRRNGILVTVELDGGNDGLNTLAPVGLPRYHQLRPTIGIPKGGGLPVSRNFALHPSLTRFKRSFDSGHLAIIDGVGYANPDLSHFNSMDTWMHGWAGRGGMPPTGWIGRWLDTLPNAASESLYAVTIDDSVPLHLQGAVSHASGLPLQVNDAFGMRRADPSDRRMYAAVKDFGTTTSGLGAWGDAYGDAASQLMDLTVKIGPAYGQPAPSTGLGQQLVLAARLINANLGIRVIHTHLGSFDTHADQASTHASLLSELDGAVGAFFGTLDKRWAHQVILMTFSEFGRRPEENGDAGTDHGTASVCFVTGANVRGGFYGRYPSLTDLDDNGNLKPQVDFRQLYATVLSGWLRVQAKDVLGRWYEPFPMFLAPSGYVPR